MARASYKKYSNMAAWDMDKGCRRIVDQSTPARRRLKKILHRQERKIFNRVIQKDLTKNEE